MNKNKEFLKAIGRKDFPSMDEISGDEHLSNTFLKVYYGANTSDNTDARAGEATR